ncbi:MAG: aminopeptidase [Candidatus Bathyarchaeota archaeon]|nr:aminopeptidase [Candidatus Bathyarchaeota archaeon]MDH5779130.1 aminopeptidase [Candidatus Bathyarchaeota archaeon]
MVDSRDTRLADILVNYSIELNKDDNVCLLTDSTQTLPLFLEVYKKIIIGGGYPYPHIFLDPHIGSEGMDPQFMKYASAEQLRHLSPLRLKEMQAMDAYIRIGGPANKQELSGIDPRRISMRRKTTKTILDERLRKKWVVTRYPTPSLAQAAGMSTEDFVNFFYNACLIDWEKQEKKQEAIRKRFESGKIVRVLADDTDLKVSIEGRKCTKCYGKRNMPDGEIYFAPNETYTTGYIKYTYPYNMQGQVISGISLKFEKGKVVDSSAEINQKALDALLDTDDGARRLGEFGIGTNEGITQFTSETLFDEKIEGTVHITPGNAYEDSGGLNKSAIHADIVKDLRKEKGGGEIQIDSETVQKDGKWVFL